MFIRILLLATLSIFISISAYSQEINFKWVNSFGGTGNDQGTSIIIDMEGNLIQCGYFSQNPSIELNGNDTILTSNGLEDIFLKKWTSDGVLLWTISYGGIDTDKANKVVVNKDGDIFMIGHFGGEVIFDPNTPDHQFTSNGLSDVFVGKWNPAGELIWVKHIAGNLENIGTSIALDEENNLYLTGHFQGTTDFDPSTDAFNLVAEGINNDDVFISKLNQDGEFIWARSMNSPQRDVGISIVADTSGNTYTTGVFGARLVYETTPDTLSIISNGLEEMFISKLGPEGSTLTNFVLNPNNLSVYPNPASTFLHIRYDMDHICNYSIIDVFGRQVKTAKLTSRFIDLSELDSGQYWIRLSNEYQTQSTTFIKF